MKRSAIIFFITFMTFTSSPQSKDANLNVIVDAFSKSSIEFKQVNINGWVKLQKPIENEQDLKEIVYSVCERLGINAGAINVILDSNNKKVVYKTPFEDGVVSITVENTYDNSLKNYESTIIIDVTQYGRLWNIINLGDKIKNCLNTYGFCPYVNICVTGYVEGNIRQSQRIDILDDFMKAVDAKKMQNINNDNLISISGYTKNIDYFVKSGIKKININSACRYSSYDDKTYFWIGTPVINVEY